MHALTTATAFPARLPTPYNHHMSNPWFYSEQLTTGVLTLSDQESRHARQSLRLRAGEPLVLFDGLGGIAHGTLRPDGPETDSARRSGKHVSPATVAVAETQTQPLPTWPLTLIVAGCKGARLDWLIEKCTELGAVRVILTEFERSVVHAGPKHVAKLRRTAIEACKQCHRARIPEINAGLGLHEALAACRGSTILAAHLSRDATPLASALTDLLRPDAPGSSLAVVIGPEGGLTPSELGWLDDAGGRFIRLGSLVLRVETAAVAVAASWAATCPTPVIDRLT